MPGVSTTWYSLRSRLRGIPADTAWRMGMDRFFRKARGSRILVYHGVVPSDPFRFNTLQLALKKFENHLRLFKKYFNVISLDEYYSRHFREDRFNVCLTFDDGFYNNYKYVFPLLEKYQVPATFFVTGLRNEGYDILWNDLLSIAGIYGPKKIPFGGKDYVREGFKYYSGEISLNEASRYMDFSTKAECMLSIERLKQYADEDYWFQMSVEHLKEMARSSFVTIGSHGYWHNDLGQLTFSEIKKELEKSKHYLENIIGKKVKALAFPYGSYKLETIAAALDNGFTQLLATEHKRAVGQDNPLIRERLTINPFISTINQLNATITGNY